MTSPSEDGTDGPPAGRIDAPSGLPDRGWLAAALAQAGMQPAAAQRVLGASRIAAAFVETDRGDRVGGTRLGGLPDLAAGASWPVWGGVSMAFLAQVDLAEMPQIADRALLPASGLLSVFFDGDFDRQGLCSDDEGLDGRTAVRVVHVPAGERLVRGAWPEDLCEWVRHPGRAAGLAAMLTLPQSDDVFGERLGLSAAEQQAMVAIGDAMVTGDLPSHWLLGHPLEIQGNAFYDIQKGLVANGTPVDPSWRLLMQMGCDSAMNLEWGDAGTLYVALLDEDLRARRWDRSRMTWQCA